VDHRAPRRRADRCGSVRRPLSRQRDDALLLQPDGSQPFDSITGGCASGAFTGILNDTGANIGAIITARVSSDGNVLNHVHEVQVLASATKYLVATEAFFKFDVPPGATTATLTTGPLAPLEETFLLLTGPTGTLHFLGGGFQCTVSPPANVMPLSGNPFELEPGEYRGFFRLCT
jgi:hypothetical protein